MLRGILKISMLTGTEYERLPFEVAVNFVRAFVTIPFSSGSLFNQWWYTQKGSTGHPTSDAHERLFDPAINCPKERVLVSIVEAHGLRRADIMSDSDPYCVCEVLEDQSRPGRKERVHVSIVEAHGLRKADIMSDSDPYCVCEVLGRPESTWKTAWKQNTQNPVWNELQELVTYRKHDSLVFSIYDYDEGFWCISERKDFLGKATLKSDQFHPDGFDGVLQLANARKHQQATIKVAVQVLDSLVTTKPSVQTKPIQPMPDTEFNDTEFKTVIDADSLPQAKDDLDKFWFKIEPTLMV
eukprot:CAMPEP_0172932542 /NCGR_PEP_ID=MMETSP1075-20121228/220052_1 /TAXON_ID=2916 /ORGANISM="Ceratium fusus, Strain PA161109" /LENGTH=296 /DNA_ID=CAMNT_0013793869 /DNA_START=476 /DNA_END=1367 /DNA_ORIENTATION=+